MPLHDHQAWLEHPKRARALSAITQPITAHQLAQRTGSPEAWCGNFLRSLTTAEHAKCLNPQARRSRLYALTTQPIPSLNWTQYGWACFSQRAAVLTALDEPQQPAAIKRRALQQNPNLTMSANNVRDIIKLFLERDLVRPVEIKGKAHLRYKLTEQGRTFQELLQKARYKQ